MNLGYFSTQMSNNAEAIRNLVHDVPQEQTRWKPAPESWSILEVINHLYDEEREDFRFRLDLLLHHPNQSWPSNDPERWVVERRYNQRDYGTSLRNFLNERKKSIAWLENLSEPNWQGAYAHPAIGRITAADMLAAWLAHDLLHLRQLIELHWAYMVRQVTPYRVQYAGEW